MAATSPNRESGRIGAPAGAADGAVRIANVPIFAGTLDDATELCLDLMSAGTGARIATANLDFLAQARREPELQDLLNESSVVVADGAAVVWLAHLAGVRGVGRVPGIDLVHELLRVAPSRGEFRVALYGAKPELNEQARRRIEAEFPGVTVVLAVSPPFRELTEDEEAEERARFAAAQPDAVFVGLGFPRQERLIRRYFDAAPGAVWIGCGGTIDYLAGHDWSRPRWLQRLGLEWAGRLASRPHLWRRYLLRDVPALALLVPQSLRQRRQSSRSGGSR